MKDLINRLRGIYVIPVNDGAGLLDGKNTFTRPIPFDTPPIQHEAANRIEELEEENKKLYEWLNDFRILESHLKEQFAREKKQMNNEPIGKGTNYAVGLLALKMENEKLRKQNATLLEAAKKVSEIFSHIQKPLTDRIEESWEILDTAIELCEKTNETIRI